MIVDTSALMAIMEAESERDAFVDALLDAPSRSVSAGTWVEFGVVLARRRKQDVEGVLATMIQLYDLHVEPVTLRHATLAHRAFQRFGKGRHPAALNFGDCFAYALAAATGEPLLYKGDDFARTDVRAAI